MVTKTEVLDFIGENPGCTTSQMGAFLGRKSTQMSVWMCDLLKQRCVTRKDIGRNLNGTVKWGYALAGKEEPTKPGRKPKSQIKVNDSQSPSLDSLITEVANTLAGQIAAAIMPALQRQMQDRMATLLPKPAEAKPVEQEVLPPEDMPSAEELINRVKSVPAIKVRSMTKILVVGLTPQQAGEISKEFHDALDCVFWNSSFGQSKQQLQQHASGVAMTFVHINHIAHNVTEVIKNATRNYRLIGGGMSQMKDAITRFYADEAVSC